MWSQDEPVKYVDPEYAKLRKAQIAVATEKAAREHSAWLASLSSKELQSLPGTRITPRDWPIMTAEEKQAAAAKLLQFKL
jgi:hypothetical protein